MDQHTKVIMNIATSLVMFKYASVLKCCQLCAFWVSALRFHAQVHIPNLLSLDHNSSYIHFIINTILCVYRAYNASIILLIILAPANGLGCRCTGILCMYTTISIKAIDNGMQLVSVSEYFSFSIDTSIYFNGIALSNPHPHLTN